MLSAFGLCLVVQGAQPPRRRGTLPPIDLMLGSKGAHSTGLASTPAVDVVGASPSRVEANGTGVQGSSQALAFLKTAARDPEEEPEFDLDPSPVGMTPEERGDYNRETSWKRVTPWKEDREHRYHISVEATIAVLWITTVAAMPFIVMKLDRKEFTRIQAIVFFIMWVILFGGVYLFTQVLYFQSNHFDTERHLTIVESVYFLSQVLTTVGYGDVVPANAKTQVFVALYVLFSLLVIANVISEVGECIAKHVRILGAEVIHKYKQMEGLVDDAADNIRGRLSFAGGSESPSDVRAEKDDAGTDTGTASVRVILETREERLKRKPLSYFDNKPPRLDWVSVLGALTQFLIFVVLGVCFYHYYPGEEKTVFNAVYMSVITLSTVGFGVITPQTEAGKVFGAFWMLFGSGALVGLIGSLTELYGQIKARENWGARDHDAERSEFFESCPDNMEKFDFVKRALLYKGLVEESDLLALETIFDKFKDKDDGTLAKTDLQDVVESSRKASVQSQTTSVLA